MQAALYFNRKRRRHRIRLCLVEGAVISDRFRQEDEKLIFVELTQTDGDKIAVLKSDHVVVTLEQKGSKTIVHTAQGNYTVTEAYADVKAAFEE